VVAEAKDEGAAEENVGEPDHAGWFVPTSVAKVVVFGVIGGWLYCAYWMYRNWQAYRRAWGYSREPFWRSVHEATGYRISPFWRAVFAGGYTFCLFPAVHRECRHNGVRGVAVPIILAILFQFLVLSSQQQPAYVRLLFSPVWVIVPVQLAINRLNWSVRREAPFGLDGLEALCVVLGGLMRWL